MAQVGRNMRLEEMLEECATMSLSEEKEEFSGWENLEEFLPRLSGHSCLLVTWKTNPEVEQFKELYMEKSVKNHKRKNKKLVDPGDLVYCNFCNLVLFLSQTCRCRISRSPVSTKSWARSIYFRQQTSDVFL